MSECPKLPNFDPDYCLKVAKWTAAICLSWLLIELTILSFANPADGHCPGWTIHARNGSGSPVWLLVLMFTAAPAFWICYIVFRWEKFSRIMYDSILGIDPPYSGLMLQIFRRFKPAPDALDNNFLFVVVSIGWSLFCTVPLWLMLTNCTDLPRYLAWT